MEARHGLGLIKLALQRLMDEGAIEPQPVEPLAHAILGTLIEAGLYVARADQVGCGAGRDGDGVAPDAGGASLAGLTEGGQSALKRAASSEPPVASPAL